MGGSTGNIRTLRLSATGGTRTIGSMIANDSASAGAGSVRRILAYYKTRLNKDISQFYFSIYDLRYGKFASRAQFFIKTVL
jgi:hypothetical protein